jgi:hypothetical protein
MALSLSLETKTALDGARTHQNGLFEGYTVKTQLSIVGQCKGRRELVQRGLLPATEFT